MRVLPLLCDVCVLNPLTLHGWAKNQSMLSGQDISLYIWEYSSPLGRGYFILVYILIWVISFLLDLAYYLAFLVAVSECLT
jgi:hypothetical protein